MERRYTIMNLSAAFIGKNASDDMVSASYNSAPMVRQDSERNTVTNCIMAFLNGVLRGSVVAICPGIQLHKYACNVLLI